MQQRTLGRSARGYPSGVAQELLPQQAAEELVNLANASGGPDTTFVIIARVEVDYTSLWITISYKKSRFLDRENDCLYTHFE